MSPSAPLVWIIEDDPGYRMAVAEALAGMAQVGRLFGSVEEALDWLRFLPRASGGLNLPDVILLDVNLPGMSGIEGVGALKAHAPEVRIVMLTIRDDAHTIYAALGAGASGYLLKSADPDQLSAAVEAAHRGGMLMPGAVARLVLARFDQRDAGQDYQLSVREMDVLREMTQGHTQKTIAAHLNISPSTVNTHVQNIYEKLHVHTASAAVAKAIRERLLDRPSA